MRIALALALAGVAAVAVTVATAGGAARGVPQGFRAETAAAVGEHDLWVLGEYRCSGNWCLALVRSTDGGKHFAQVGLPSMPSQGIVPSVVFAGARDGFAYVENETPLYVTHDSGSSWHRAGPANTVSAFATAGGYAYVLAGGSQFARSPTDRDAWQKLQLLKWSHHVALAARGSRVWLLGPPRQRPDFDTIGLSSDHGRTFTPRKGPCLAELGGALVSAPGGVVWAVCPTGMMAGVSVSTNGGRYFRVRSFHDPGGLREPSLTNGGRIAAASAHVAVLTRGAGGAFLRTTDDGRHWGALPGTAGIQAVFWFAFTTQRIGSALVELHGGAALWRTTDSGATWHSMPIH